MKIFLCWLPCLKIAFVGVGASTFIEGRQIEVKRILPSCREDLYGRAALLMHSWRNWRIRKMFLQTRKFGHVDLPFCRNFLTPRCEFTMEEILFVVRSLKKRLVINLESLLLHENDGLLVLPKARSEWLCLQSLLLEDCKTLV